MATLWRLSRAAFGFRTSRRAKSDGSGYWARLSNASGELGGIIANDNVLSTTTTIVEIRSGDAFFKTSGFDQWTKAG